ncbi:MAG: choice-of-anchor J domain-containing protein, partial [Rhodanobacteraceae bacterium]|nr:choice-of-anchor J domain-containing protein [Rhodanobacteraceae bacterium]
THTVTSSVGTPSGTITPLGAQTVNEGDTIAFTLAADPGYAIDNVASTCGGTLDGGTGVFTTAAITADCTVTANFAPITWTVTSSVGTPSGTITPSGAQTVNEGGTLTFTLTADPGYEIDTVGGSCGGTLTGNSFETDPVTADCDVIANFTAAGGNPDIVCTAFNHPVMQTSNGTYINWETGAWSDTGSLSGAHFNPYGSSNLTFFWPTPTTNAGVTSGGTFAVLSLGDTIGASSTFARSGAPTAWRAGADGYLGFSFACSTASVCYGYMHFTTTGPSGYPATMGDYCWNKAGDPITIAVPGPFLTVTPSVGVGSGAISPSTPQSVNVGGTKTFTLAPAAGFHTLSVTGTCGGTLTGNSFTTDPVTADCTVVANFEANPSAAITPASLALSAVQGASDNGAINIANVGGGTLTYSITESPARLPTIPTAMDSPVVQSRDAQPSRAYAPRPNPQPQAVVIDEGFEDVAGLLGAGWITANHSSPMGAATWAQCGGTAIPPAFDGDPNSCALVNYTSTTGTGTISNWLLTPEISFNGGSTASFYTRTSSGAPYADRLEVRVCSSGDCTDFGTGATDVGNFTTLLLTINPGLQSGPDATGVNGYPDTWTQFTLSGLPTSGTGRIAFRYFVTDGGPSGSNSNIIGIDRLVVDNGAPGGCAMPTDIPWMSVAPGSGAIAAGANEDVTVTADATGLAVGTYTADVCVATNDPVTPVTAVPVSFTVTSSAIAPTLGKTFAPDTVLVTESSVATLTLSNANATDAVLTAPLVDTLPAGLNVTAATTTCLLGVGGSMPAPMASVTLPAGAKIPANGSCTVSITVSTPTPGSYVNTIAAGALQTDLGSNAAEATATLTVNPLPPPLATFTPGSFSFTVQADQTTSGTLNIANAAGRDVLSYSIDAREVLRPVARASGLSKRASAPRVNLQPARLVSSGRSGGSASAQPLYNPLASYTFQLDDGTYENSVGFVDSGPPAVEWGAVWINRFNVTEALTIDSISIMWPTNPEGTLVGMQPNLVVYYDADADGDPTNAQRIGTDQLVTIAALDVFETYTTNFAVPGAGDVYVGFVDQWSLNGYSPGLYPAALDETASQGMSWLAVAGTPPTDVDNLGNNDMIGTIDDFAMPGNWLIRATGTSGAPTTCTGAVVGWMSASPASGTVNSGA